MMIFCFIDLKDRVERKRSTKYRMAAKGFGQVRLGMILNIFIITAIIGFFFFLPGLLSQ
jgi:hypothetical protein